MGNILHRHNIAPAVLTENCIRLSDSPLIVDASRSKLASRGVQKLDLIETTGKLTNPSVTS